VSFDALIIAKQPSKHHRINLTIPQQHFTLPKIFVSGSDFGLK
jgi:hypothetical protein